MTILFIVLTSLISVLAGFLYSRLRRVQDEFQAHRSEHYEAIQEVSHHLERARSTIASLEPLAKNEALVRERDKQIDILLIEMRGLRSQQNDHDRQLAEARAAIETAETRRKEQVEATARALEQKAKAGLAAAQSRGDIDKLNADIVTMKRGFAKDRAEWHEVQARAQEDMRTALETLRADTQSVRVQAETKVREAQDQADALVAQARADASEARAHTEAIVAQAQRIAVAILEDYGPPSKSPELGRPTTHVQVASNIFTQSVQNFYGTLATDMNTAWRIALNDRYTTTNPDIGPLLQRFLAQHTSADSTRAYAKLNSIARGITDSTA